MEGLSVTPGINTELRELAADMVAAAADEYADLFEEYEFEQFMEQVLFFGAGADDCNGLFYWEQ
jgi:hypothetical protein